jgi:hypothetical protein
MLDGRVELARAIEHGLSDVYKTCGEMATRDARPAEPSMQVKGIYLMFREGQIDCRDFAEWGREAILARDGHRCTQIEFGRVS